MSLSHPLSLVNSSNFLEALAELSTCGRLYNYGKALGEDLRMKIIQDIVGKERDYIVGKERFLPWKFFCDCQRKQS